MINLEELQKMPLPKLLVYREALEALVGKYEQDVYRYMVWQVNLINRHHNRKKVIRN